MLCDVKIILKYKEKPQSKDWGFSFLKNDKYKIR
jgi:hypothetical protein